MSWVKISQIRPHRNTNNLGDNLRANKSYFPTFILVYSLNNYLVKLLGDVPHYPKSIEVCKKSALIMIWWYILGGVGHWAIIL